MELYQTSYFNLKSCSICPTATYRGHSVLGVVEDALKSGVLRVEANADLFTGTYAEFTGFIPCSDTFVTAFDYNLHDPRGGAQYSIIYWKLTNDGKVSVVGRDKGTGLVYGGSHSKIINKHSVVSLPLH